MSGRRIAILCDSGTNLPDGYAEEHDVRVVPLCINFPDGSMLESGVDISPDELVDRLDEMPSTSLPSPLRILEELKRARDDGAEGALVVTIASGLSGTNNAAKLAASQLPDLDVAVVDSKSIGLVSGLALMEGVRLLGEGMSLADVEVTLTRLADETHVFFSVRELEHLRHGGRISEPIYALGKVLNIKPIITCDVRTDGHYTLAGKARGWERALRQQVRLTAKAAGSAPCRVAVCCSRETARHFDELEAWLREAIPGAVECVRSGISADLMVHTGAGLVGMGCQPLVV